MQTTVNIVRAVLGIVEKPDGLVLQHLRVSWERGLEFCRHTCRGGNSLEVHFIFGFY